MIIEQHYDEEVLAEFLAEPGDAVSRDKHLTSCGLCLRTLDTLRATAHVLREPAVWDPKPIASTPRPETLAFLRGFAKSMADEDTAAAVWVKQLLAGPREGWAARLAEHPEWRTAGMVRALLGEVESAINTVPADAASTAALAVDMAITLRAANARHLQGLAHYYHAYALWYTGAVAEAVEELDRADESLRDVIAGDFDRARVDLMRAMIYEVLERRDEALSIANAAAAAFGWYEDSDRFAAARSAAAITLQSSQRYREALLIHAEISGSDAISDRWRLSALHNMAICYSELREYDRASDCLVRAITGYERVGMLTFRSRSRWALGEIFARRGTHEQALALYDEVRREFEELGMAMDVALVALDMAEALLACDRAQAIRDICKAAVAYFASAGLAQTEPARRALAYLQEAAVAGQVTPAAISGVRAFLLAPEQEPNLLFAEPPQ